MIIDRIENAGQYEALSPDIAAALNWLKSCPDHVTERSMLTPAVSTAVSVYTLSSPDSRKWEAHDHLVDIHYVKAGCERIRWANRGELQYSGKEPGKDVLRFSGEGTDFLLKAGMFCILFPEDAHTTKLPAGESGPVTKAIIKISI